MMYKPWQLAQGSDWDASDLISTFFDSCAVSEKGGSCFDVVADNLITPHALTLDVDISFMKLRKH